MNIIVTGGSGFLGKYVVKKLKASGYESVSIVRSSETDLRDKNQVEKLFTKIKPDIIIHLAATVGGIGANMKNPGLFFYDNILMGLNVIECGRLSGVKKIIQIGTVCAYPKFCPVPFKESDLWNGYPEETNAPYGIAKKALFVMLDSYKKQYNLNSTILVPCNLYGPYDNFNPDSSHVIPALIKKIVEAKDKNSSDVISWGSGNATREFLYAADAADAIVKSINIDTDQVPINLGGGIEISIKDVVNKIAQILKYNGKIIWDSSKPDGQPRRSLDLSLAKKILDWSPSTSFDEGLEETINWYLQNRS